MRSICVGGVATILLACGASSHRSPTTREAGAAGSGASAEAGSGASGGHADSKSAGTSGGGFGGHAANASAGAGESNASAAAGKPPIGDGSALTALPAPDLVYANVVAISADGTYVVGTGYDGGADFVHSAVRWKDDVPTVLANSPDWAEVKAVSISDDGTVAGTIALMDRSFAFKWDGTSVHELPRTDTAPDPSVTAFAISGDGNVVVGATTDHSLAVPLRWTGDTEEVLPLPDGRNDGAPLWANEDGSVLAGTGLAFSDNGLRWTADGVESFGPDLIDVKRVSENGQWIVGSWRTADSQHTRAVRIGASGPEYLPAVDDETWNCAALSTNRDGSIVVGFCSAPSPSPGHTSFVWSAKQGSVRLDAVLAVLGIDASRYDEIELVDISSDGTTLLAAFHGDQGMPLGARIRITGTFP